MLSAEEASALASMDPEKLAKIASPDTLRKLAEQADHLELCSHCLASKPKEGKKLSVCGKCKDVKYCSRDCQVAHWKAGHKDVCATAASSAAKPSKSAFDASAALSEGEVGEGGARSTAAVKQVTVAEGHEVTAVWLATMMERHGDSTQELKMTATVCDVEGREKAFTFSDVVPSVFIDALQTGGSDRKLSEETVEGVSASMVMNVSMNRHHKEMLAAAPWVCSPREEACWNPATKLICCPTYLGAERTVHDLCPLPVCDNPVCEAAAHGMASAMLREIMQD
jgi:hypothetical protein